MIAEGLRGRTFRVRYELGLWYGALAPESGL
jgi:hypothetical protein